MTQRGLRRIVELWHQHRKVPHPHQGHHAGQIAHRGYYRQRLCLQQWGPKDGEECRGAIFGIVFGVNEVTLSYMVGILTAERIQRGMGSVARRLDLYRAHLAATSDKEIYLVGVFFILRPCMVVYIIATCHQRLCHQILIDIAKVGCQLVAQQFLIRPHQLRV